MEQRGNSGTKPVDNQFEGVKDLVAEALFPNFIPKHLNGIQLWRIGRQRAELDVFRHLQGRGTVPSRVVDDQQDVFIRERIGEFFQKYVHADGVGVWQHQCKQISIRRGYRAIQVAVFPDVMARHAGAYPLWAPTPFGFIDPPKSSLVLKHHAQFRLGSFQFPDRVRDFFYRLGLPRRWLSSDVVRVA